MIEYIKEQRIRIDGLAKLTRELKPVELKHEGFADIRYTTEGKEVIFMRYNSKEIESTINSLYLAKAWLGKILQELGTENPYVGGYKTKEDITPTQDVCNNKNGFTLDALNHIEKVVEIRARIEDEIKEIKELNIQSTREYAIARTNVYNHLCEAKFWLGFELERIKNS